MDRRFTILFCALALVVSVFVSTKPAAAQDQTYYTYVSEFAVPRTGWNACTSQESSDNAIYQGLVADGTLVDWGSFEVRVHQLDGYTHGDWMTATSRANLLKALEKLWTTATNPCYAAATKHQDLFLATIAHGGKTVSNATGYLRVGFYQAKPGESEAVRDLLLKKLKPMLDSELAGGTLLAYNLDTEDIHTVAPGSYNVALLFPDGAAIDKFYSDLDAAEKSDPTVLQALDALTIEKEHHDGLTRVTAFQHK
ncbi:MAG TPA: hypothetical protein VMF66_02935 [Candidatus Acidoferrum sp.]|nr:hypothetical protein [Candidatus Acidoferrum sp.]